MNQWSRVSSRWLQDEFIASLGRITIVSFETFSTALPVVAIFG